MVGEHISFLSEEEKANLEKLDKKVGGKTRGDVPLTTITEARRLGLVSRFDAFRAITAIFRADSRKPSASDVTDETES